MFEGPEDTGGVPLTNYEYTLDGGGTWNPFDPPVTGVEPQHVELAGLANGQSVEVAVRARNVVGPGPATGVVQLVVGAPWGPFSVNPIPRDGRIDLYHALSTNDNGSPITNYEYSLDAGMTWISPDPPETDELIIVDGVTNGQTYTPWVRAVNARGPSTPTFGLSVTVGVPLAPRIDTVVPGRGRVTVFFTRAANNGSPVTNYEYQIMEDPSCLPVAPQLDEGDVGPVGDEEDWVPFDPPITQGPVALEGLTDGVCYRLSLRAVNARGAGLPGSTDNVYPGAPTAPTDLRATPGDTKADIAFTLPDDNGSPVTKYWYQAWYLQESEFGMVDPPAPGAPLTIPNLENGLLWDIKVSAVNANGLGPWSKSVFVTPRTVPDAPSNLAASPMYAAAEVAFVPGEDGGAPITGYESRWMPQGGQWSEWASAGVADSPVTVSGLPNGVPVEVELRAVNAAGPGAAASVVVTPVGAVFSGLESSFRVFDSRPSEGGAGPLQPGVPVVVDVQAPAGAVAVAYNVTLVDTVGTGHVAVGPAGADLSGTSTANWFATGQRWANAYVSALDEQGRLQLVARGAPVQAIVDVTGFYLADGQVAATAGSGGGDDGSVVLPAAAADALFHPVAPRRAYDSRGIDGPISSGQERTIDLAPWVPAGATAVAYTLTVTDTVGAGHLAVGVPGAGEPGTSIINWFASGQNVANSATGAVSGSRSISVFGGGGPTEFVIDVLGYFAPIVPNGGVGAANDSEGLRFTAIPPSRAYDSRAGDGPIAGGQSRTTTAVPLSGAVPAGVGAVAFNLTETDTLGRGHLRVAPGGSGIPAVSTINWYANGMRLANGSVVAVNDDQMTTYARTTRDGSTQYLVDIGGYYN